MKLDIRHLYYAYVNVNMSRDSSVSTVTMLRAGWPVFDSRQGQGFFFFSPLHQDRLCSPPSAL